MASEARSSEATDPSIAAGSSSGVASRVVTALLPVVLIVLVCVGAVVLHVANYQNFSPLDEQAHLDYVNRVASGDFPALGDKLTVQTRRELACRGLETPAGFDDPSDCSSYRTKVLPEKGNSYEATQPPLYYGVTAALRWFMPGSDLDSTRLVGAFWLAAGAIALYFALRRFAVGTAYAVFLTLVLALTPPLLVSASVVTDDIALWTWGACALLAVVTLLQGRPLRVPHLLIGAAIGVVGGLIKPSAILILLAFALASVLAQWWAGRPKWGWLFAGSMVVGAAVATGAWGAVVNHLQHLPLEHVTPWSRYHVRSLDLWQLVKQPLFNLVTPIKAFLPIVWRIDWRLDALIQVGIYVEIGILLLPFLSRTPNVVGRSIGIAYLSAVAISGPYYVVLYFVATHILYGSDFRFAFGLIPMMGVVLVAWVQTRWQRWTLAALLALPAIWYLVLVTGAVNAATR